MRIMLVDASRVTLKLLAKTLLESRHDVVAFSDGSEALNYLQSGAEIDLLMTSFEIPGVSGIQLCWEARLIASSGRPLYVIAMSSNNDADHLAEALDSGADDFVSKPPSPVELEARLRAAERMNLAQRELVRLATRDAMTDLLNRRTFFARAEDMIHNRTKASVILLDVDLLRHINETHGYPGGDTVVMKVAQSMKRYQGMAARIGGEEFAVLLPGLSEAEAVEEGERLRWSIADQAVTMPNGQLITVTASLGVAERKPDDNVDEWMESADIALYAAKAGGRNRVVMSEEIMDPDAPRAGLARGGGGRALRGG